VKIFHRWLAYNKTYIYTELVNVCSYTKLNKIYCCVLTNVVLVYITIIWRKYLFTDDSLVTITRPYTQNLLMVVPTPNKMYCCVLTNVVLVYITIIWPKLCLENSRQKCSPTKKQPTKFDIFSERYFEPWSPRLISKMYMAIDPLNASGLPLTRSGVSQSKIIKYDALGHKIGT
jgi:hypothetical protein